MIDASSLTRRSLLGAGLLLVPATSLAAPVLPPGRRLNFRVLRNGTPVGEHHMSFMDDGDSVTITTEAKFTVKVGPITAFRYSHNATERWSGGQFSSLESRTNTNGKMETATARRTAAGVALTGRKGRALAPASAHPLTHWNMAAFGNPLFNPQEGKLVKVSSASRGIETIKLASGRSVNASRYAVRGEVEIDDWYDENGAWVALKGKLNDGSLVEYRRT